MDESIGEGALSIARDFLRARQAQCSQGAARPPVRAGSKLEQALASLARYRCFELTDDPEVVRRGNFRYVRSVEESRIQLAEDLIRRIDPGPWEDANYLAMLAYQAASVHMAFPAIPKGGDARWERFLLGTLSAPEVNAFAQVFGVDGHTVVALNSGLVDFIYQSAKSLVEAQSPSRAEDPRFLVVTKTGTEHIEATLQRNQGPVNRLYRTLEAYFFKGYPRAFAKESPLAEHMPALAMLVGLAERWVIAHEFGHGFAGGVDWENAPVRNPSWAEEFFADQNATILSVLSAWRLDRVPPEFALSSGIFALACLDILRRALCILRLGSDSEDVGSDTHPPYQERAAAVVETFYHFFSVKYDDRTFDLELTLGRGEKREPDDRTKAHIRYSFESANGLFAIWKPVRDLLLRDHASERPLHAMWC